MSEIKITEYTDPGCPFAWSAEPARRRLQWLFGDQLRWELCMVGLSERPSDYEDKGFTPERLSASLRRLSHEHHMPMDFSRRPRMAATVPACRAVVAVRRQLPEQPAPLTSYVRTRHPAGIAPPGAGPPRPSALPWMVLSSRCPVQQTEHMHLRPKAS